MALSRRSATIQWQRHDCRRRLGGRAAGRARWNADGRPAGMQIAGIRRPETEISIPS